MSRIGRKPITLPDGVTVNKEANSILVKGPKGELSMDLIPGIDVQVEDGKAVVKREMEDKKMRAFHGMTRALLNSLVEGVSKGFEKQLEIVGIGWRAQTQGKKLILNVGYSNPVEYVVPEGIEISTDGPAKIIVRGIDKQKVGQVAAEIRGVRPPEPYKGKGIRYVGEHIVRKAGKAGVK